MSMDEIVSEIRMHEGVLELAPGPGSSHPEISWGDFFYYYAPDGRLPRNRQPYATIVTKNYPEDRLSELDSDARWRLNMHVGRRVFAELLGYCCKDIDESAVDYSASDVFLPHPLYGAYGWVSVVVPAQQTTTRALEALHSAYLDERRRVEKPRP